MARVAVLGAGFQGTCLALELARRGCAVDLFDRNDRPITQAGLRNEGKIHLGYVYANDPTGRTAGRMVEGASEFFPLLARWLGREIDPDLLSTPFDYGVPRDSMVSVDRIRAHFRHVDALIADRRRADAFRYPTPDAQPDSRELGPRELAEVFDPDRVVAAFRTGERSVHVEAVAALLRRRLLDEPRVTFHPRCRVTSARPHGDGVEVALEREGAPERRVFPQVANCLWGGRLEIDRTYGIEYDRPWLFRVKHGIRLHQAHGAERESVTLMLGPYGDVVRYADGTVYLSWYPACLAGLGGGILPPEVPCEPGPSAARAVSLASHAGLAPLVRQMREIDPARAGEWRVRGNAIFAWGSEDIVGRDSELHQRHDVGVRTVGPYHTIDTGKYTMAPHYAIQAADRIREART